MQLIYLEDEIKKHYINDLTSDEVEVDSDIKNWVDKINFIPNVCTTQCCQGHPNDGYLSVMVSKDIFLWFENVVIKEVIIYCTDIIKRFEEIKKDQVYIRYTFWFKDNSTFDFFETFLDVLSKNPVH